MPMLNQQHTLHSTINRHRARLAPARTPLPARRVSEFREGLRIRKRGLYLGTAPDGLPFYLKPEHLRTHLHVLGVTGTEKSRLMLWLFKLLCYTNRPIILADFKGGLVEMVRNWALTNGFAKRLVLFDMSANTLLGYNPLRENGLRLDLQAQWVSEGVKSAWGQATFDQTPQLARFLYLVLFVSRALKLSLVEGLEVLQPYSYLRDRALKQITDPFVSNALRTFDNMNDRRKEEMTASTTARLEAFCRDAVIRQVICAPESLDLESALLQRRIILLNFAKCQPLLPDPLKLLARLFTSDLLAHVFKGYGEGVFSEHKQVYFMVDKVQNMATRQLCDALDEGRGIGLHCIISHQHMSQLSDEDQSGYLFHSVMGDARTKLLTGGLAPADLQLFGDYLLMDHYDPWRIKFVQRNPIFAPVESTRRVVTESYAVADAVSDTENFSEADSVSHSDQHSISRGHSVGDSLAFTEGEQDTYTYGENASSTQSHNWGTTDTVSGAHTTGTAVSHGRGRGTGSSESSTDSRSTNAASGWSQAEGTNSSTSTGDGEHMLPPEERIFEFLEEEPEVVGLSTNTSTTDGRSATSGRNGMTGSSRSEANSRVRSTSESEMDTTSASASDTDGWSHGLQDGYSVANQLGTNEAWSHGTNRSTTRGQTVTNSEQITNGFSNTVGHTSTRGGAFTQGQTITRGTSVAVTPFHEYHREEIETPTFLSPEEQLLLVKQRIHRIPARHFLLKAPGSPDCIIRAPDVPDPVISDRRLTTSLATVYAALPCYTTVEQHSGEARAPHPDHRAGEVIDVAVQEVIAPEVAALPSSTDDAQAEKTLWERVRALSFGRREKS
ncbi:MAG TPA: hypothetical protein VFC02_02985 [Anaerolineales bacterium]|jgi:hypothetical protein|nr:hypothetical protein [Anaerolineales bacterium]